MILGSGLGVLADEVEDKKIIPYSDIPHFHTSTVAGHKGQLVLGMLEGLRVVVQQGRIHFYEGYTMEEITFPLRVMIRLGVRKLIVTNAAGGINSSYSAGDLMLIRDHINFMGTNPLIGPNDEELGPRFPDMSEAYSPRLREITKRVALNLGINLHEGVYIALTGPSYETPAEIKFFSIIGADAVGMSTVPETIVARHMGIEVLGISCITNSISWDKPKKLSHTEVIEVGNKIIPVFTKLIKGVLKEINRLRGEVL